VHGFELFADMEANYMAPEYIIKAVALPQMNTQAELNAF
jgi:hypothetical protein